MKAELTHEEKMQLYSDASKVVKHLSDAIGTTFEQMAVLVEASGGLAIDQFLLTASGAMEALGDVLNHMDAVENNEDAWVDGVFERMQAFVEGFKKENDVCDVLRGFMIVSDTCAGCGSVLLLENAWMTDGCPCNSRLGVNSTNETRWRLLMALQQRQAREAEALAKFKEYVHRRLDEAGVPSDPPSPHQAEGCRIGGRLDLVLSQYSAGR